MKRSLRYNKGKEELHQWLDRIIASGVTVDREILGEVSKVSYIEGTNVMAEVIKRMK